MSMIYKGFRIEQPEKDSFYAVKKNIPIKLTATTLGGIQKSVDKMDRAINKPAN